MTKPPKNWDNVRNKDTSAATRQRQQSSDDFAMMIGEIILHEIMPAIQKTGANFSRKRAAVFLNDRGIPTRRNGKWSTTQVSRVMERLKVINKKRPKP